PDLVVGGWASLNPAMIGSGAAWVVRGNAQLATLGTLDLGAVSGVDGFRIPGIGDLDMTGYSVSSAGDINGDGIDDLLIAAPQASPGNRTGKVYVVFGG